MTGPKHKKHTPPLLLLIKLDIHEGTNHIMIKDSTNHLSIALSTSFGLFVAPMTMTAAPDWVARPSHSCMNWALIIAVASWSC